MKKILIDLWFNYLFLFYSEPASVLSLLNKDPMAIGDPDKYLLVCNKGDVLVVDYGLIYLYNKDYFHYPYDLRTIHLVYSDEEAFYHEHVFVYCVNSINYGKDCFIVEKGNEAFDSLIKENRHLFEIIK